MHAVVEPGRPDPVLTPVQRSRAGWVLNGLIDAVASVPDRKTATVFERLEADPWTMRANWIAPRPSSLPTMLLQADASAIAVVEILTAVVALREGEAGRGYVLSRVAATLSVDPAATDPRRIDRAVTAIKTGVLPPVSEIRRAVRDRHEESRTTEIVEAALAGAKETDGNWVASGRVPATVRTRVGAGMVLAGPGLLESAAPPDAVGVGIKVVDLVMYPTGVDAAWRASPFVAAATEGMTSRHEDDPRSLVLGELSRGWFCALAPSVFTTDTVDGTEVRITAVPSVDGGRTLLRRLGAETSFASRRPDIEPLPAELGDGVVIHRQLVGPTGGLVTRIDLVRNVGNVDVVFTTVVDDPALVNATAAAVAVLAAAVETA